MRPVLALTMFLAACSSSTPGTTGDACDPSDRTACGDGLACESVGVNAAGDVNVCTWECDAPGVGDECGPDAACIAVPSGVNACLALCDVDGGCANGEPGYPFFNDTQTCVCIPWR